MYCASIDTIQIGHALSIIYNFYIDDVSTLEPCYQ